MHIINPRTRGMPMKVISVWNPKGGQGKSMIAINLAAAAVEIGLKTIVIDRDPEQQTTLLYQNSKFPFEILADYPKNAPDVDLVIVDHMATDREAPLPPVVVIPVIPKRTQFAAYKHALPILEAAGKRIITVVTGGDKRRSDEKNAVTALKRIGAFEIPQSVVFTHADNSLTTVFDPKLNRVYGVNERRNDFAAILSAALQNQMEAPTEKEQDEAA